MTKSNAIGPASVPTTTDYLAMREADVEALRTTVTEQQREIAALRHRVAAYEGPYCHRCDDFHLPHRCPDRYTALDRSAEGDC